MIKISGKKIRTVTPLLNPKKEKIMKTIFYILIALCMTTSFTACTADNIADNEAPAIDEVATTGENGQMEDEDEG
ncbi:hypothetical protein GCM10022259_27630 [Aquimarina mytili]